MPQTKYEYDYPEQRQMAKNLVKGDQQIIADRTGKAIDTIYAIFKGRRKITPDIEYIYNRLAHANLLKADLLGIPTPQEVDGKIILPIINTTTSMI